MTDSIDRTTRTLEVARDVASACRDLGIETALIGALALAYHGYARATEDLDLASCVDPFTSLRELRRVLEAKGFEVRFGEPDAMDPLGGVLTVTGTDFDAVQVVNFHNPLSGVGNPGREAIETASATLEGYALRVVDVPHLIALKLYAGGPKSRGDVLELLARNREVPREEIADVCSRHHLGTEWADLLAQSGE